MILVLRFAFVDAHLSVVVQVSYRSLSFALASFAAATFLFELTMWRYASLAATNLPMKASNLASFFTTLGGFGFGFGLRLRLRLREESESDPESESESIGTEK